MSHRDEIRGQLAAMSRRLGRPEADYVIMGEGNTSARIDESTFWVKASGTELHSIDAGGFVEMAFAGVLDLLASGNLSDEGVKQGLATARVDPAAGGWPSIETPLHALALTLGGARFVGHTHPTAVNAILCSQRVEEAIQGRLFPEEVTFCGPAPAYVPYTDPGRPLARRVQEVLAGYVEDHGEHPRVILLQNHGLFALGRTPQEVENTTAMYVKAARVLLGTYSLGGPRFLSHRDVERIHTRPDEVQRIHRLGGLGAEDV